MNSDINKDIEVYERIDILCKKIESYTTKVSTIKNEVKTNVYAGKVKKLVEMINSLEANSTYTQKNIENVSEIFESVSDEEIKASIYDPNSANFCYKDRLDRVNGDVSVLLEELKNEDKLGYRNAYVINEIKKCVDVTNNNSDVNTLNQEASHNIEKIVEIQTENEEAKEVFVKNNENLSEKIEEKATQNSTSFITVETVEGTGVLQGFFETETTTQNYNENITITQSINLNTNGDMDNNIKTETMPTVVNQTSFLDEIIGAIKSIIQSIQDMFK